MTDHHKYESLYFSGDYEAIIRSLMPRSRSQLTKESTRDLLGRQESLFFLSAALLTTGQVIDAADLLTAMNDVATSARYSWTNTRLMLGLAMALLHRHSEAAKHWAAVPKCCYSYGTRLGFEGWFQVFVATATLGLELPDWNAGLTQLRKKWDTRMSVDGCIIADVLLEKLSISQAKRLFKREYSTYKSGNDHLNRDLWMLKFYGAVLEYYFDEISKASLCRKITAMSNLQMPELTFEYVFARNFRKLDRV